MTRLAYDPTMITGIRPLAILVTAALVIVALAGCDRRRGGALQGRASGEWRRSYTLEPGGELQIVGATGTIDVQGGAGSTIDVRAERIVRASSDAAAAPMVSRIRLSEDVTPDRIVLRSEGLGGIIIGVEVEVDFHITVPAATRLRLRTANGDITVANVEGAVVASSTSGGIAGNALGGAVDARATNGSVTMDVASLSRKPIDLRAANGHVTLALPPTANADIAAECINGTLDIAGLPIQLTGEQTQRRVRGRLNEGGTPVNVTTTDGDIHLRVRP